MFGVAQLINEASERESDNDRDVALRLYKTAFNNLLDINGQTNVTAASHMPGFSPFEIRSVADYINHQICHIQFVLNHPREAITQFKKYIDTFKQHTRAPEYAFEHAAWLSQQYLMFADLFHQAVVSGTKASKGQHPGLYYYESALQMIERRKYITEYTNDTIRSNQMPVTNELLSTINTSNFKTFLRKCGWTCIAAPEPNQPAMPSVPSKEGDGPINYSEIIIRALYKAIEHFEEWNRPRMQNYISVMIADEYQLINEYQKAQALWSRSLVWYEKESWTQLAKNISHKLTVSNTDKI